MRAPFIPWGNGTANSLIAPANPASSWLFTPFMERAVRMAPTCAGVISPAMIDLITDAASSRREVPRRGEGKECLPGIHAPPPGEEVRDDLRTLPGEDALRVELDPLDGVSQVPEPHDASIVKTLRGDSELGGECLAVGDQRMVPGGGEGIPDPLVDPLPIVADGGGFAMDRALPPDDPAPEGGADGLVAQADPQCGYLPGQGGEGRETKPRLLGPARPGREDDPVPCVPFQDLGWGIVHDDLGDRT